MGDVARGHEGIAGVKDKKPVSDGDLELSGKDKVCLIFTRMRMARHAYSGRGTYLQEAICPSRICAGQTYRPDANVKVKAFRSGLMFD
jgi:hypothetical protein